VSNENSSRRAGPLDLGWASGEKLRLGRAGICLDARRVHGKAWGTQSCFSCVPSALCSSTHLRSLFSCSSLATRSNGCFTADQKPSGNDGFHPQTHSDTELPKGSWVLFQDSQLAFPSYVRYEHFAEWGMGARQHHPLCPPESSGHRSPFFSPTLRSLR